MTRPLWNDRALGTEERVEALLAVLSLEEKVAQLIDRKRGLADAVLGNGEAALTELDDAELRDLVRLGPDPNRT